MCAVVSAATWETRGKITCIFHMVCVSAHSRQYSGSCSGVMFLLLLLPLVVAAAAAAAAYSACCVSGSVLFLVPFPPCPILQSVDQVTVLCVLFIHPSYTTHTHTHTLHSLLQHPPYLLLATPQTPKPLATLTQGHALTAALLSGPTCSSTTGKWLLLLLLRNQWSYNAGTLGYK